MSPAATAIYTLSLHDALPISLTTVSCGVWGPTVGVACGAVVASCTEAEGTGVPDSCGFEGAGEPAGWLRSEETRLNSSHMSISYAVFCLKKKKKQEIRADITN